MCVCEKESELTKVQLCQFNVSHVVCCVCSVFVFRNVPRNVLIKKKMRKTKENTQIGTLSKLHLFTAN